MSLDLEPVPSDAGEGVRTRIDISTRLAVFRIRDERPELPQAEIARLLGISPASVTRILAHSAGDLKALAQRVMQSELPERLEEWAGASAIAATKGDHRPAYAWAVAAGIVDPPQAAGSSINVGFQVVVAPRPGLPDYAVNELPTPVVTRVSAPASHVQAQAPSAMPDVRHTDQTPAEPTGTTLDANVPTHVELDASVPAPLLSTTYTQRAPSTPHPPTAPTIPPAHTSMLQRPRTRLRR